MDTFIINANTLPKQFYNILSDGKVSVHKENGVVILTPIKDAKTISGKQSNEANKKRKLGFLKDKVPPLPDSFFDPLPEEELQAWGL